MESKKTKKGLKQSSIETKPKTRLIELGTEQLEWRDFKTIVKGIDIVFCPRT